MVLASTPPPLAAGSDRARLSWPRCGGSHPAYPRCHKPLPYKIFSFYYTKVLEKCKSIQSRRRFSTQVVHLKPAMKFSLSKKWLRRFFAKTIPPSESFDWKDFFDSLRTGASRRSFLSVCVVVGPCDGGEALQTSNDHIVIAAGAVNDQQFSVCVPAAYDPHMTVARVKDKVAGERIVP